MSTNVKLIIAYDGSNYFGWQSTRSGPSIESKLQGVLEKILSHPVKLQAASRTDRGVHAKGQVVNFFTDYKDLDRLLYSINCLLTPDICALSIEEAAPSFHPTLDCKGKVYKYTMSTKAPMPLERHTIWHYPYPVNLNLMRECARGCIGKKDFKAFTNTQETKPKDTIREIYSFEIERHDDLYAFTIYGDHFLYKMVRNLVGTICDIGQGRLPPKLDVSARKDLGVTAPAHALILNAVIY